MRTEHNIFEGADFGSLFVTRNNRRASFIGYDKNTAVLVVEGILFPRSYHADGTPFNSSVPELAITGPWVPEAHREIKADKRYHRSVLLSDIRELGVGQSLTRDVAAINIRSLRSALSREKNINDRVYQAQKSGSLVKISRIV